MAEMLAAIISPRAVVDHNGLVVVCNEAWDNAALQRRIDVGGFSMPAGVGTGCTCRLTSPPGSPRDGFEAAMQFTPFRFGESEYWVIGPCAVHRGNENEAVAQWEERMPSRVVDLLRGGFWLANLEIGAFRCDESLQQVFVAGAGGVPATFDGWLAGIHESDLAATATALQAHLKGQTPVFSATYRIRSGEGTPVWMRADGRVVERNDRGESVVLAGLACDVTDSISAAQEREPEGARLSLALDAAHAGLWDWNVNAGTFVGTPHLYLMLGETPVQGADTIDWYSGHLHPDDRENALAKVNAALEDESVEYRNEFRLRHTDGSYRWIRSAGRVVERDAAGHGVRMIGLHIDIQESKEADRRLRDALARAKEHEQRIRDIIDHVPASVAFFDNDMRFVEVSRRWFETYHIKDHDVVGKSVYDVMPGIPKRWHRVHQRCLKGASERHEEDYWVMPDGTEHWDRWEVLPWYRSGTGRIGGIAIYTEDITERKRAELELESRRDELAQVSRVALLDQIGIAYAHELKQPLAEILNYSRAVRSRLENAVPAGDKSLKHLDEIEAAAKQAADLIDRLREFAARGGHPRERTTIGRLIDQALGLVRSRLLKDGVQVERDDRADDDEVMCDPIQLQQVIINIVLNALDSMSGAGVAHRRLQVKSIRAENALVQIDITDCGPGLEDEAAEIVFERFFSTKATGLGMGLAISRAIVEAHGGDVKIVSCRPATFAVRLPRAAGGPV